jgi:hypothetical protein
MIREPGHMDNINCLSIAQMAGSPEELHHVIMRERRHQGHASVRYSISKNSEGQLSYYQIEGNIAREIEDVYTYNLMKNGTHFKSDVTTESTQLTDNYPIIKFYKIPSRMEGKRYKPALANKNLPSYVINKDGHRQPLDAGSDGALTTIRNEDLLDIQLANECNSLV